jgi:hypothetical protein
MRSHRDLIVKLAARHKLPAVLSERTIAHLPLRGLNEKDPGIFGVHHLPACFCNSALGVR